MVTLFFTSVAAFHRYPKFCLSTNSCKSLIKIIGTRHGEKLYETLVTREEMAKSEDMGNYYRIPCDARDLNYDKYFVEGEEKVSTYEDYNSNNTKQLSVEEMKQLLLKLPIIRRDVLGEPYTNNQCE